MITTTEKTTDTALIRRFLTRTLSEDAVIDHVTDAVFTNVVQGNRDPAALAEDLPVCIRQTLDAATDADWQAVAAGLIADALELEAEAGHGSASAAGEPTSAAEPQARATAAEPPARPLRFIDYNRQRHAQHSPIAGGGEFMIGDYLEGGGTGPDGEFKITLSDLGGYPGRPRVAFDPHLGVFCDGIGALRRAVEAGLLDALIPVEGREEFARRLLAIGIIDASDEPLPAA